MISSSAGVSPGGGESTIRDAEGDDLAAVSAIYDHQVRTGVATFDMRPAPVETWRAKLASTAPGDHFLVAGDNDRVLGFAYSSTYRARPAYDLTRETTIYLEAGAVGRGLGRRLYDVLLARLRADGVHVALAVVATPNAASEALHRACGYTLVGTLPQVGRKFDRWIDTALYALVL